MGEAISAREIRLQSRVIVLECLVGHMLVLLARHEDFSTRLDDIEGSLSHVELASDSLPTEEGWADGTRSKLRDAIIRAARNIFDFVHGAAAVPPRGR